MLQKTRAIKLPMNKKPSPKNATPRISTMHHKKLAICIPTYNRRIFLQQLIESIIPQLDPDVEVVISDNASIDDTESYCQDISLKFPQIRYYRSKENLGPDANMLKVVELSTADYCWWMGDDDKIVEDGISRMLRLISKAPSIVVCNSTVKNIDFSRNLGCSLGNCDVSTADSALKAFGAWITFISSLCFSREKFMMLSSFTKTKIGSQLMQCYPMLDLIKEGPVGYDSVPLVEFRSENSGGYNLYRIFVKQFDLLCEHATEIGFLPETVAAMRKDVAWKVLIPVTIERKISATSLDIWRGLSYVILGKMNLSTKFIVLVSMILPSSFFRLAKPYAKIVKGRMQRKR